MFDLKPSGDGGKSPEGEQLNHVRALLHQHFGGEIGELTPLGAGEFSRTLAFSTQGGEYVIRLSSSNIALEVYAKDDYAFRHFASRSLPIPRVLAFGEYAGGGYAISTRSPGRVLTEHSPEERRAMLPSIFARLDSIRRVELPSSTGYGDWTGGGNGRFPSWHAYLAQVIENDETGYYENWHALFSEGFLERDLYEAVYRRMLRLAEHCPNERELIHNDYWFMNMLGDGKRITGVIDWANSLYGDGVYEIARLAWGAEFPDWWFPDGAAILEARYGAIPGYAERLACYQCHIALDDLRFYAKTGRRKEYDWARSRLLAILETRPD